MFQQIQQSFVYIYIYLLRHIPKMNLYYTYWNTKSLEHIQTNIDIDRKIHICVNVVKKITHKFKQTFYVHKSNTHTHSYKYLTHIYIYFHSHTYTEQRYDIEINIYIYIICTHTYANTFRKYIFVYIYILFTL